MTATVCIAVGDFFKEATGQWVTLAERRDATSWSTQPTPNRVGTGNDNLRGLSCTSAAACTAVGYSDMTTLAERWDGSGWSIQSTPDPANSDGSVLSSVSCSSAANCGAVGNNRPAAGTTARLQLLAERYSSP